MDKQIDITVGARFDRGCFSVSELFHENTKIRRRDGQLLMSLGPRFLPAELRYAISHSYKAYRFARKVQLSRDSTPRQETLEHVLLARRSVREYSGAAVSLHSLSRILEFSYGITGEAVLDDGVTRFNKRAAPSAGALFSNEIYAVALNVDGLEDGLYHYQPQDRSLECLQERDLRSDIEKAVLHPEVVANASVVLIFVAIFQRTYFKYGERGYRFALIESGHIAQNFYLVSTALGLGAVALGGFLDDQLNELLGINGVDEAVIYLMALGQPALSQPVHPEI